jgi:ribosome-associated protein
MRPLRPWYDRRGLLAPSHIFLDCDRESATVNGRRKGAGLKTIGAPVIRVTASIALDESEISESFIRASGPGGQKVNKVATAVQLRFDVRRSPSLNDEVRARLERLAGRRLTRDGVLVITAQRYRTQERNRQDALDRLLELIREAAVRPVPRRPTRPTLASRKRRIEAKKRRGTVKALRRPGDVGD